MTDLTKVEDKVTVKSSQGSTILSFSMATERQIVESALIGELKVKVEEMPP